MLLHYLSLPTYLGYSVIRKSMLFLNCCFEKSIDEHRMTEHSYTFTGNTSALYSFVSLHPERFNF